jgi:hypothetical protein
MLPVGILVPSENFRAGYVLWDVSEGYLRLLFRSDTVMRVDSGVGNYPCYHTVVGYGNGSAPEDSMITMSVTQRSTCSNDTGSDVKFDTVVADSCMKAVKIAEIERTQLSSGAITTTELAVVFDARY